MRWFQVAIVIGALLALGGVYVIYPADPAEETNNDFIDPDQYYFVELNIFWDGRLFGNYRETAGRSLRLHIYDIQQFVGFTTEPTSPVGLFSTSGSLGTFSANLPMPGKYYVILEHGPGNEQTTQTFSLTIGLDGTNAVVLALGGGLIATGVIIAVVGYRAKKKAESQKQVSPQDVVLFGQPPPPPPPAQPQQ